MKRIIAIVSVCVIVLLVAAYFGAKSNRSIVEWNRLVEHAKTVEEPHYTLAVNGKIIEHDFDVRFDRCTYDEEAEAWIGYEDGCAEVPLLTVLTAMGAELTWQDDGTAVLVINDMHYRFVPEYQAIYFTPTEESKLFGSPDDYKSRTDSGLLIMHDGDCFRYENGEYIVDLGSLHALAIEWDFTWEMSESLGIVNFVYPNPDRSGLPAH